MLGHGVCAREHIAPLIRRLGNPQLASSARRLTRGWPARARQPLPGSPDVPNRRNCRVRNRLHACGAFRPCREAYLSNDKAALSSHEGALLYRKAALSHGRTPLSHGRAAMSFGKSALLSDQAALSHGTGALSCGKAALSHGKGTSSFRRASQSFGPVTLSHRRAPSDHRARRSHGPSRRRRVDRHPKLVRRRNPLQKGRRRERATGCVIGNRASAASPISRLRSRAPRMASQWANARAAPSPFICRPATFRRGRDSPCRALVT